MHQDKAKVSLGQSPLLFYCAPRRFLSICASTNQINLIFTEFALLAIQSISHKIHKEKAAWEVLPLLAGFKSLITPIRITRVMWHLTVDTWYGTPDSWFFGVGVILLYRCYYLHMSRDLMSPECGIFWKQTQMYFKQCFSLVTFQNIPCLQTQFCVPPHKHGAMQISKEKQITSYNTIAYTPLTTIVLKLGDNCVLTVSVPPPCI